MDFTLQSQLYLRELTDIVLTMSNKIYAQIFFKLRSGKDHKIRFE